MCNIFAFSLDNFLLAENQAKVDPLPSATTTKLLQDTGISDYLQVTACDHAVLPFTTATGRLNDECGKLENSITLPADVSVNIQSDCTSVTMCSDIGYIDKKIQSTVKLDPCTYEITLGIETMETTVSLLQFQWGKPQSFALQGGLRMDYVIHDLTSEGMYLVSVDMGLCMETSDRDSCDVKHTVLDNVKLAKKSCNWNNGFAFSGNPSFDLSTWLSTNSYTNSIPLSELVVIELERYLQFEDYLQPSHCVASAPPFTPVNSEGWAFSSGCQNASTLTTLPGSGIVCNLGDSCTKIDCCVDIAKLDTTFRVYADLDVCSKEFTVGVENFNRTISLYSFQYAQEDTFSFGGLVNIKYKVVNYQSERVFVVNMDIEVCYSAAGPCAVQHTVLTDVKLPKSSCNYSQPYAIPDFSLVSYMSELDVNTNVNQLPSWAVDLLMEELGISGFQKDPQCDLSSYSGALSNGWNSTACGELITLPQLPAYTRCRLPSYCTGAQCCSNIGYLGRKLEAFVLVDPCSYSVSIGLEKRNINVTLLEFTQGSWQTVTLGNLLRLQYKAEELTAEKVYLLYMTISICFETVGDCRYTYTVFDGVKIPKQPCDWTGGYAIPGFNLNSYLTGLGYSTSTPLNSLVSSQLLEYLGVASLLKTTADQCQMSDPMYTSPTNGWTKDAGCTSAVDLPTLGSNSVCHLYDTCTGISCCLHSTTVDRNFNVFLKLDPCTQKLDIGIEKYQFDFSLYTFTFETTQYFHIDRVIEIEYKITDLVGEMVYLVDMKVKICFNDPSPCDLQDTIVVNTKLPKMVCPWFRGYPDPSWSLNQWYLDNSLTPGSNLDSSAVSSLMESSQIGEYLLSPMVSRVDPFGTYAAAYLGWSSECTEAPVTLLQMDQSVISCNLESTCRGLSCALDVPFISKTFEFYMRLEQCDYMLKVGIERQQYERTLKGYQWGEWTHVDLNGILKMSFVLHDLYAEPAFLISMKLSLCWEANQPCGTVYNIFDKVRLPKKVCDWDKKFLQNDFSLTQYKTDNSISTLDDHHVSDILRLTGISQYMKRTPCSRTAAPYTGADANNWKNDCVDPVGSLLNLGSDTTCHLDSSCTAVDCCVDSTSLGLTLNGYVRLDPCNYKIYIGLEGIDLDYTLIDFSFGTVQHYAMNEVFNLDFVVDDLTADKVYVVSMNISVCLESGGACEVVTSVFQDHRLPKAECDYDSQFVIPGFSLNEYLDDKSVPTNSVPLDIHTIAQLLHDTALAPYMMDNACDQTVIPYYPNDKGWNRGKN
ncbi:uncharacterized protein LOC134714342 [Mytilus trossulus]|uniref:uncharacterized protein LOC134714342 n=1 Tax=Mytilus trossulus TaxID=6551 RepID=UPI00300613CE